VGDAPVPLGCRSVPVPVPAWHPGVRHGRRKQFCFFGGVLLHLRVALHIVIVLRCSTSTLATLATLAWPSINVPCQIYGYELPPVGGMIHRDHLGWTTFMKHVMVVGTLVILRQFLMMNGEIRINALLVLEEVNFWYYVPRYAEVSVLMLML
jgi:hypothetical protein